jgi:hypothetical protein
MWWAGDVIIHMGEMRNAFIILVEKLEGNRPVRRPRLMWIVGVRIGLKE